MGRKSRKSSAKESKVKEEKESTKEPSSSAEDRSSSNEPQSEPDESPLPVKKRKTEIKVEDKESAKNGDEKDDDEENEEEEDDEEYEIDAVVDDKVENGKKLYKVRWKGYSESDDTWEEEKSIKSSTAFASYKKKLKNKKTTKTTKTPSPTKKSADPENQEWEITKIVDMHTHKNGQREFLVRWKGFRPTDETWEPEDNLKHLDVYTSFLKKLEKVKELTSRELRVQRNPTDRLTYMPQAEARRGSKRFKNAQRKKYYDQD